MVKKYTNEQAKPHKMQVKRTDVEIATEYENKRIWALGFCSPIRVHE